jgi:hypothetical protein
MVEINFMSEEFMTINWKLKRKIKEMYGSQKAFAIKVRQTESDVSRIVNGKKELKGKEVAKWSHLLNPSQE